MTRDRLLVRRRPGDLETPVSAMLKLGADEAGSFLFESIHGGERLGRYSFIGLYPQRWMRVRDGIGEESTTRDFADAAETGENAVAALHRFAEAGRADADASE
ncbi:MAG: anthranilate synthase component I, partial [Pseudomonadota bacterium]|nr:anthranilate synthase component I [Pseudomonadota bacterium]